LTIEVGCPYWRSCSANSLNIEPNGDIYTCQEMADVGVGKLGNAISGEWDDVIETFSPYFLILSSIDLNIIFHAMQLFGRE
jgi:sulfatase maturation enzyme AslB (radical SAM superfamily)